MSKRKHLEIRKWTREQWYMFYHIYRKTRNYGVDVLEISDLTKGIDPSAFTQYSFYAGQTFQGWITESRSLVLLALDYTGIDGKRKFNLRFLSENCRQKAREKVQAYKARVAKKAESAK